MKRYPKSMVACASVATCLILAGCAFPSTTYDGRRPGKIKRADDKAQLLAAASEPEARTGDGRFFLYEFSRERDWILTDFATTADTVATTRATLRVLFEFDTSDRVVNSITHKCGDGDQSPACGADLQNALLAMLKQHYDGSVVEKTLQQSAFIDDNDEDWFAAVGRGDLNSMQRLLDLGMPVMLIGDGQTSLHMAARRDDTATVEFLLGRGAAVDSRETATGRAALHIAAARNNAELAAVLVTGRADVEVADFTGQTPLHHAAYANAVEVAEILLAAGAKADAKDEEYHRPIDLAIDRGHVEVVVTLLHGGADPHRVTRRAAETGNLDILAALLDAGGDIDGKGWIHPSSPISHAAAKGHLDAVQFLLDRGADVNAGNPLLEAVKIGDDAMIERLLAAGADMRKGPLVFAAVDKGDYALTETFLVNGADPNKKAIVETRTTWDRVGPLELARSKGRDDLADLLVRYGGHE